MIREPIRDACDHRWSSEHRKVRIDRLSRPPEIVRIPTATNSEIEALVYRADGDGVHPAVALADDGGTTAQCHHSTAGHFADEGFTAIAFARKRIGSDAYRRVVNWATSQIDVDGTRIFAFRRRLDDLRVLQLTTGELRIRAAIVQQQRKHDRATVRVHRGSWHRRALTSGRRRNGSAISFPVLFVVDGETSDSCLSRRMATRSHGIEVFVAKPSAPEWDREHLDDRLLGVEVDFLRFHAGLPATMRPVR